MDEGTFIFVFSGLLLVWTLYLSQHETMSPEDEHDHVIDTPEPEPDSKIMPILNPLHNLREMTKQMLLLEDHLFNKQKRCRQCIRKHFLTIEALAEEAIQIDKERKYLNVLMDLPSRIRAMEKRFVDDEDFTKLAQDLRNMRKEWVSMSYNVF